jgi:hypothetical protein
MKTSLPLPREKSTIPTHARDPRALSKFLLIPILGSSLPAAEINSTWNGSASQLWNNPANWTPNGSPSNTASDSFDVVLPAGLGSPVTANVFPTIDTLAIGAGSQLNLNLNITLTVRESITNDDRLSFGNSGNIILSLSSLTPASTTIDLLGSGEIAMGSAGHILFGTTGNSSATARPTPSAEPANSPVPSSISSTKAPSPPTTPAKSSTSAPRLLLPPVRGRQPDTLTHHAPPAIDFQLASKYINSP